MENHKKLSVRKTFTFSIIVSLLFIAVIYIINAIGLLDSFRETLLEDTGAAWYYWKLPKSEFLPIATSWLLYIAHQIIVWRLIFKLKKQPTEAKGEVGKYNIHLLLINALFIALHIVQTILFYDGLAQTVPVMSSQGSVIVMLVLVLIMMNGKRGLFFGKKVKLPAKGVGAVYKVHSYFIAWALVYTFWFHPTEGTIGHLMGFFYMFILMIQMSMANTSLHNNRKWVTLLEVYVAIHGSIVAIDAANGMWPMFLTGFLFMFVVTEIYGIFKKKSVLGIITGLYAVMVLTIYSGVMGNSHMLSQIHQITWIPIILYALVFIIAWIMDIGVRVVKRK